MTLAQRTRLNELNLEGFSLILERGGVLRVAKGADHRVIQADGTVKRGEPGGHGGYRR